MGKENKSILSRIFSILKWIIIGIVTTISVFLIIRLIGKAVNNKTPNGGINESINLDINNSTQWFNIYGQDLNNPVILYLHGGPGSATSNMDYVSLRKWSDVYTVVTWDQRDVGLSYHEEQAERDINIPYTKEIFMNDALELTKFLLNRLNKEKIILIGHSWGSIFGANLALEHPEYYQYYIGTGQLVDMRENEKDFVEAAKVWTKDDKEGQELLAQIEGKDFSMEYAMARQQLLKKYGFLGEKSDFNELTALFFNPYYSLWKVIKSVLKPELSSKYLEFLSSPEFDKFSLTNRYEYQIPYYNIDGDHDYQANTIQAQNYFKMVMAPRKKLYIMENMGHGLLGERSEEFSGYMHEIAKLEQANNSTTPINNNIATANDNSPTIIENTSTVEITPTNIANY